MECKEIQILRFSLTGDAIKQMYTAKLYQSQRRNMEIKYRFSEVWEVLWVGSFDAASILIKSV